MTQIHKTTTTTIQPLTARLWTSTLGAVEGCGKATARLWLGAVAESRRHWPTMGKGRKKKNKAGGEKGGKKGAKAAATKAGKGKGQAKKKGKGKVKAAKTKTKGRKGKSKAKAARQVFFFFFFFFFCVRRGSGKRSWSAI